MSSLGDLSVIWSREVRMTPGNGSEHSKDPVAERRNLTSPAPECWVVYMSDRVPYGTAACKLLLIDFAARERKVLIRARGSEKEAICADSSSRSLLSFSLPASLRQPKLLCRFTEPGIAAMMPAPGRRSAI